MIVSWENFKESSEVLKGVSAAYMVGDLGNGGQERQLYNLIISIASSKRIILIPWDFIEEDRYVQLLKEEPNIIIFNLQSNAIRSKLRLIRKVLNLTKADYFHSYSYHLNFVAWVACFGKSRRAIGGVRNRLVLNRKLNGVIRFYLSLIFPYHRISNNYNCFKDLDLPTLWISKVFTTTLFVHNGIDTERFRPYLRTKDSEKGPLRSISVGRLFPVKQVEQLIDWVASMKDQGININHRHAGQGPELDKLKHKVKSLKLEDNFIFEGNVNDVPEFMNKAQLFIHAARFEGCPNVVMEAMACGLPVLSSNAGDTEYIVDQGQTGYVYQVDDQEALLNYSLRMIAQPNRLKEMGKLGAAKAEDNFGIAQYTKAVLQTYKQIGIKI